MSTASPPLIHARCRAYVQKCSFDPHPGEEAHDCNVGDPQVQRMAGSRGCWAVRLALVFSDASDVLRNARMAFACGGSGALLRMRIGPQPRYACF